MEPKQKKGGFWLVLSACWWVVDGLYKDDFFKWAKPMMPDLVLHPPVWSFLRSLISFGPPVVLAAVGLYFIFVKGNSYDLRNIRSKRRVMLWVGLFAGIFVALVCGAMLLLLPSHNEAGAKRDQFAKNIAGPPIEWRFDKPATVFWYARKPGEGVLIEAVVIHGTNKSDFALKNVSALLTSDLKTAQVFTMRVNPHGMILSPKDSAKLIPPRASFDLTVGIEPRGLTANEFLQQYGTLHFTFSYEENGAATTFNETFSLSYLEDQIEFIEQKTREKARVYSNAETEAYSRSSIIDQRVTSTNQSGGITAHTVNVAPSHAVFSEKIKAEILAKIPKGAIELKTVGGSVDQDIGNEVQAFLEKNGYEVRRSISGSLSPPPDQPFSMSSSSSGIMLIVAPSIQ